MAAALAVVVVSASYATLLLAKPQEFASSNIPINVSCVGDSITQLSGYTDQLQTMLGENYRVGNVGVSGSAVSTHWFMPYVEQSEFQDSVDFSPSVVVIMLGTNDVHMDQSDATFFDDYENLVAQYEAIPGDQQIILVAPPPIYDNNLGLNGTSLQNQVIPLIQRVGEDMNLPVLDVNTALMNHPEYFVDGVHPNDNGATAIATEVDQAILWGDYSAGPPF